MRIDGPNRVQVHGPSEADGKAPRSPRPSDTGHTTAAGQYLPADAEYEPYLRKVRACQEVNLQAVAEAKELLDTGQLDSPEAAARAAEQIISTGI